MVPQPSHVLMQHTVPHQWVWLIHKHLVHSFVSPCLTTNANERKFVCVLHSPQTKTQSYHRSIREHCDYLHKRFTFATSHIIPQLSTSRYSFVKLNKLWQCDDNKIVSNDIKRSATSAPVKSPVFQACSLISYSKHYVI